MDIISNLKHKEISILENTAHGEIMKKKIDKNQNMIFKKKIIKSMKTYRTTFGLDIDNPVVQLKVEINNLSLKLAKGDVEFQSNLFNFESESFLVEPFVNNLFFTREKFIINGVEPMLNINLGKFIMETISIVFQDLNSSYFINNIYLVFTIHIFDCYLYPGQNKERGPVPAVHPPYKRVLAYGFLNMTELLSQGKLIKGIPSNFDIGLYILKEPREERLKEGI